jgi:hypothetical protein
MKCAEKVQIGNRICAFLRLCVEFQIAPLDAIFALNIMQICPK